MKTKTSFHSLALLSAFSAALSGCIGGEDTPITAVASPTPVPIVYVDFGGATKIQTAGPSKLQVFWTPSSDSRVAFYNVYDASISLKPVLLKSVRAPTNSTMLNGLNPQGYYLIRVRAADSKGVEDKNLKDLPGIPYAGIIQGEVQSSSTAMVTFNDGSNADKISVYCKTPTSDFTLMGSVTNVNLTQVLLTGLSSGVLYTCRAALTVAGYEENNIQTASFTPMGSASQISFSTQPGGSNAGDNLGVQPVVTILDSNNNIVNAGPDSTAQVTLTMSPLSPSIGTLRGSVSVNAVGGIATFTGLAFQELGSKIITATKQDTSSQNFGSPAISADSNSFSIAPGVISKEKSTLTVLAAPPLIAPLTANGNSAYTVTLALKDQYSNPVQGVKVSFASSNTLDSLTQPTKVTDALGVTSGQITATAAGTRTLNISSPTGLTTVVNNAVYVPGNATKVAFVQQPTNSPTGPGSLSTVMVAVQDPQGNTVTSSTANVTLSIFTNPGGGSLGGPATVAATNGVAAFSGLGIDKTGTGYKLVANSAPLAVAYSNSFNMTPGVPSQLKITGPSSVKAGVCSTAVTIQLQDWAGNPSNATANTPVILSGVGSGAFYSSGTCVGNPVSGTLNFASGSNLKTLYFLDQRGEGLTVQATDPSAVMSQGSFALKVTPSQIKLAVPASAKSGVCSQSLDITTYGVDNAASPVFVATPIQISGLLGTQARLFSSSSCQGAPIDPNNFSILAGQSNTKLYLLDNKSETVTLNVLDPNGEMGTTSSNQVLVVAPSKLNLTGPASAVAGKCSSALVLTVQDSLNNPVAVTADTNFSVAGLQGTNGSLYSNNSCSQALGNSVTVFANTNYSNVWFKDSVSESVALSFNDPSGKLSASQQITIAVSPSNLAITGPASAKTGTCSSAFTVRTQDTLGTDTPAITPIVVNLGGAGTGGTFYGDSNCQTPVTQFTFNNGDTTNTFYFMGLTPAVSPALTLTAADQANVLDPGSLDFTITPAPAWIGGGAKLSWFSPGAGYKLSTRSLTNNTNYGIHFDATHQYLYAVDYYNQRVIKYDYVNKSQIGWLGGIVQTNYGSQAVAITGSNVSQTMASLCAIHASGVTPGWCIGGTSPNSLSSQFPTAAQVTNFGAPFLPKRITDDGQNIYVVNSGFQDHSGSTWGYGTTVSKYDAATGTFLGWIGRVGSQPPSGPGYTSLNNIIESNSCQTTGVNQNLPTPGWCMGGQAAVVSSATQPADGGLYRPKAIGYFNNSLYVGSSGAILRYDAASGVFTGWIGWISNAGLPSGPGVGASNTCNTGGTNKLTPGWCIGGSWTTASAASGGFGGPNDFYIDGLGGVNGNGVIYTVDTNGGKIVNKYDLTTGAWLGTINSINLYSPQGISGDGSNLYIADYYSLYKMTISGSPVGWVGQVGNTSPTGGGTACTDTNPYNPTPGWCVGGNNPASGYASLGYQEGAMFGAITSDIDGAGNVLVGMTGTNGGYGMFTTMIQSYNIASGAYQGALNSVAAYNGWVNNAGEYPEAPGYDPQSFASPVGATTYNGMLYVVDEAPSIKQINLSTGKVVGQVGLMMSPPTATASTACDLVNFIIGKFGPSGTPGWCYGIHSLYDFWQGGYPNNMSIGNPQLTDGAGFRFGGITSDGNFLYATDYNWHRVQKWRISDGAYMGWIGQIGSTSNISGCTGTLNNFSNSGWCKGGSSTWGGSGGGALNQPAGIAYSGGELFVIDRVNQRIARYNATSGTFDGWTGRIGSTSGLSGCTTQNKGGYLYPGTSGNPTVGSWCRGGASAGGFPTWPTQEYGGGFNFQWSRSLGITADANYLYVMNDYYTRVDKIYLATGSWVGAVSSVPNYAPAFGCNGPTTNTWVSTTPPSAIPYGCNSFNIWYDGNNFLYGIESYRAVWKMNINSGNMVGWFGAVGSQPSGGAAGCTTAAPGTVTPGWCTGGGPATGLTLGRFSGNAFGLTGDSDFVYVTDYYTNRVTRIPK